MVRLNGTIRLVLVWHTRWWLCETSIVYVVRDDRQGMKQGSVNVWCTETLELLVTQVMQQLQHPVVVVNAGANPDG